MDGRTAGSWLRVGIIYTTWLRVALRRAAPRRTAPKRPTETNDLVMKRSGRAYERASSWRGTARRSLLPLSVRPSPRAWISLYWRSMPTLQPSAYIHIYIYTHTYIYIYIYIYIYVVIDDVRSRDNEDDDNSDVKWHWGKSTRISLVPSLYLFIYLPLFFFSIFIDYSVCKVTDYIRVIQCFECFAFGHFAKHCKFKQSLCRELWNEGSQQQ